MFHAECDVSSLRCYPPVVFVAVEAVGRGEQDMGDEGAWMQMQDASSKTICAAVALGRIAALSRADRDGRFVRASPSFVGFSISSACNVLVPCMRPRRLLYYVVSYSKI